MAAAYGTFLIGGKPVASEKGALDASANLWFGMAVIGQWFFACYIFIAYGVSVAGGNVTKWNHKLI